MYPVEIYTTPLHDIIRIALDGSPDDLDVLFSGGGCYVFATVLHSMLPDLHARLVAVECLLSTDLLVYSIDGSSKICRKGFWMRVHGVVQVGDTYLDIYGSTDKETLLKSLCKPDLHTEMRIVSMEPAKTVMIEQLYPKSTMVDLASIARRFIESIL